MARSFSSGWLALVACAAVGCTGSVGGNADPDDPGGGGNGTGTGSTSGGGTGGTGGRVGPGGGTGGSPGGTGNASGGGGTGGVTSPGDPTAAGLMPLRRLSRREYINTVADLLGTTNVGADDLPGDSDDPEYPFRVESSIAKLDAMLLRDTAEAAAANVASRLTTYLPCDPVTAGEAACARQFITTFGLKAYRRPLLTGEVDRLVALYNAGRTTVKLDFRGAIGAVIEGMLQSPGFLYHWEMGPGPAVREGSVLKLDGYLLANRLSYALLGTMPDPMLFDAAAGNRLGTVAEVETQVRRLLTNQKAKDTLADFFYDWLDIAKLATRPKDSTIYPMFNDTLITAMSSEYQSFVSNVMNSNGSFTELMTGTRSFANQPLAAIYGLTGVTGTNMRAVTLNADQRGGLLTLSGFLANTGAADGSNPVARGKAVFTRLLCGEIPPPPANVPPPEPATAGGTTRARFERHGMNDCTGACHVLMDPLGYAFENFDGIGRHRTTDNNLPVNAASSYKIDGVVQTFADARELSRILANSNQVQSCLATQWLRYGLGRHDSDADRASLAAAVDSFKSKSLDVRELVVSLATSRTFRYRASSLGEVLP